VLRCLSLVGLRRRRRSALFPYTTLFRSETARGPRRDRPPGPPLPGGDEHGGGTARDRPRRRDGMFGRGACHRSPDDRGGGGPGRSEEHTSELQSRFDLVCRLLLEKKKIG